MFFLPVPEIESLSFIKNSVHPPNRATHADFNLIRCIVVFAIKLSGICTEALQILSPFFERAIMLCDLLTIREKENVIII